MADFEIGGDRRPFRGYIDPPIYGRDPGYLIALQNMRVMPGGYLEARGGFEELKPASGTGADPISAGIYTGAHEHTMPDGYVFTYETTGGVFSSNLAQRGYYELWSATDDEQHDAIYVGGVNQKFSRVVFTIIQATTNGAAAPVLAYEYAKTAAWDTDGNAATTGTFTVTSTPSFTATGEQVLEVAIPTDWVAAVRNGIYGYWIRIRLATLNDGFTTAACRQGGARLYSDWPGARQIYVATANSAAATNNGTLKFYGQSSATQVAYTSVSTSLFSGNFPRVRFASYRNILYFVNGKESKRWDHNTLDDIGFDVPTSSGATANVAAGTGLTGFFKYAITYGHGPEGEWGESNEYELGNTGAIANKEVVWTLNLTSIPATAEKIYLYRTTDLTSVPTSAMGSFPYFRIQTLSRDATGTFPTTATDNTAAMPFPPVELDIVTNTAPTRSKFITVHKNRMFLGSNNQYPGRVWWSDPFEAEAFNQDENFADFTRSTGGQVTGLIEFNDQVVVFTEDQMFGIANVDQDQPSIYVIHPGIGCIAPDSIQVGFGVMCWLARNGVYVWDGNDPPRRVSDNVSQNFGKMSVETHGGSRGGLHNRLYDIALIDNNNTFVSSSTATRFRYDLVTDTWAFMTIATAGVTWAPLATVTAPLGHSDAGQRHPLFAQTDKAGTDYSVYLGEQTTQDDGSNYTCYADVHFGPSGNSELTIDKAYAYYKTDSGWGTPALSMPNSLIVGNEIGSPGGTLTNFTIDAGTDYTRVAAVPTSAVMGTADVSVRFSVASASGGTVNRQRLLSVGIEAVKIPTQWGKS